MKAIGWEQAFYKRPKKDISLHSAEFCSPRVVDHCDGQPSIVQG